MPKNGVQRKNWQSWLFIFPWSFPWFPNLQCSWCSCWLNAIIFFASLPDLVVWNTHSNVHFALCHFHSFFWLFRLYLHYDLFIRSTTWSFCCSSVLCIDQSQHLVNRVTTPAMNWLWTQCYIAGMPMLLGIKSETLNNILHLICPFQPCWLIW